MGDDTISRQALTNLHHLATLSPEDAYAVIKWLMTDYGLGYSDTRGAIIAWLGEPYKGEE